MNCEFCSSPVHVWFQCPKKPDGWKPARLAKESTAAKAGGRNNQPASHGSSVVERRGASCDGPRPLVGGSIPSLPVDTNSPEMVSDSKSPRLGMDEVSGLEGVKPRQVATPMTGKTKAERLGNAGGGGNNGESPKVSAADFDSGSVGSTPASPSKFNKNEYQRLYMREVYRPRLKAKKDAAK